MTRKIVAIVVSVLINIVVLGWLHAWSTTSVAEAAPSPQSIEGVITLPTITVHPTRAQMQSLQREARPAMTSCALPTGDGNAQTLAMPFYSFAQADDMASA